MCQALLSKVPAPGNANGINRAKDDVPMNSADVPLGDGMVGQARLSILNRREQIRRAVDGAQ